MSFSADLLAKIVSELIHTVETAGGKEMLPHFGRHVEALPASAACLVSGLTEIADSSP